MTPPSIGQPAGGHPGPAGISFRSVERTRSPAPPVNALVWILLGLGAWSLVSIVTGFGLPLSRGC